MTAVGQPISRVDGWLKVTGGARYTADLSLAGAAHAAIVHSTIANGRTVSIDTSTAEKAPGVLRVLTHRNMPRMNRVPWSHLRPQGQTYPSRARVAAPGRAQREAARIYQSPGGGSLSPWKIVGRFWRDASISAAIPRDGG